MLLFFTWFFLKHEKRAVATLNVYNILSFHRHYHLGSTREKNWLHTLLFLYADRRHDASFLFFDARFNGEFFP